MKAWPAYGGGRGAVSTGGHFGFGEALGIGARSLWKAGLLRQDTWKERRLGQAIPDTEPSFLVALPGAEI